MVGLVGLVFAINTVNAQAVEIAHPHDRFAHSMIIAKAGFYSHDIAPNTLSAMQRAMDYGADGTEVDLRMTRDGVIVAMHDPTLDRRFWGLGGVEDYDLAELRTMRPRMESKLAEKGAYDPATSLMTFEELLVLAKQRSMLLVLDVKTPSEELETQMITDLDQADAWANVIAVPASFTRIIMDERFDTPRFMRSDWHTIGPMPSEGR